MLYKFNGSVTRCFVLSLSIVWHLVFIPVLQASQQMDGWLEEPVTIHFQNEPLKAVLMEISKQTGISILYDEALVTERVFGKYNNIPFSEAINRIFKGKNKTIRINKTKRVVIVNTFGAKEFIWAEERTEAGVKEFFRDSVTLDEIQSLQMRQYREFQDEISDESEVVENDLTRKQLREIILEQSLQFESHLLDDDEVIENGKTRGQLRDLIKLQDSYFVADISDSQLVEDDLTRSELRELILKQMESFSNDQTITGGLGLEQLRLLIQRNLVIEERY